MKPLSNLKQNASVQKTELPLMQQIAAFLFSKKIKKRAFLLEAGKVNDCIFFVKKGLLRVYLEYEGKEVNTWFVKENDFISSVNSYYNDIPSEEYIQALEDCEILYIKKSTFETLLKYNHKLALFSINELYIKLCEYSDQCQLLRFMNAEKKYEFLATKKPDILGRLSQKHIASFIGIETTYLSKIISNHKN
ncbi:MULTISPECIES: Crp/Fnr family transcriptional regulator [Flavobacterium]|uniref:Crp/Fnr family transcriptional regulator n=1 Tax=Flavobacterium keumense TaxID=1306518 RepID=A0ABY8N772_9FLAO|nr:MULTISPECIES: Crp/Fnr family transcriptional regulator [Flavobacterium]WGK95084.1 Crp/Fnr family transcriptional regulator [Flavobacterium keumense]